MAVFLQDLRYAARQFRSSPGFFAVAELLIALGVADNTPIFTLVNTLLLRPLPVRDPQNLVQLFEIRPKLPPYPYFDYPLYKELASRSTTLSQVVGQWEWILPLEQERGGHEYGTQPYLCRHRQFLQRPGVRPQLGRVLEKETIMSPSFPMSIGYEVSARPQCSGADRTVKRSSLPDHRRGA